MADRLAPFLDRLGRLALADLQVLSLPRPDTPERRALLERIEAVAAAQGRTLEIAEARTRIRDLLIARMNRHALEVSVAGPTWRPPWARPEDTARLVLAVEDAAVAEIVADIASPEDVAALREPFDLAASMVGTSPQPAFRLDGRRGIVAALAAVAAFLLSGGVLAAGALAGLLGRRRRSR